jgi:hypothetical protein
MGEGKGGGACIRTTTSFPRAHHPFLHPLLRPPPCQTTGEETEQCVTYVPAPHPVGTGGIDPKIDSLGGRVAQTGMRAEFDVILHNAGETAGGAVRAEALSC